MPLAEKAKKNIDHFKTQIPKAQLRSLKATAPLS